jgi:prevent-host-death family protein
MEATLREVQDHLPEYIARAQAGGEALTITDNGRPVARLVPLPKTPEELEREALERLRAMPWIRPGDGGQVRGADRRIPWPADEKPLSQLLLEDRE